MNEGKSVKAQRAHFEVQESRTAENGLEIVIFVPEWSGLNISARFTLQGGPGEAPTDPRPYLRKAIETLQAELADIDKCPVHRLRSTTPPAADAVEAVERILLQSVSYSDDALHVPALQFISNRAYRIAEAIAAALAQPSGIERLVEAATKAAERFREYERHHLAKMGDAAKVVIGASAVDAKAKADRNREMAELLEAALSSLKESGR